MTKWRGPKRKPGVLTIDDLILQVSAYANIPKDTAKTAVEAIFSAMTRTLRSHEDVIIPGFGSFYRRWKTVIPHGLYGSGGDRLVVNFLPSASLSKLLGLSKRMRRLSDGDLPSGQILTGVPKRSHNRKPPKNPNDCNRP